MKNALTTKLLMKPAVVKKGTNFTALELIKDGKYTWASMKYDGEPVKGGVHKNIFDEYLMLKEKRI